jgi:hypothetical protein
MPQSAKSPSVTRACRATKRPLLTCQNSSISSLEWRNGQFESLPKGSTSIVINNSDLDVPNPGSGSSPRHAIRFEKKKVVVDVSRQQYPTVERVFCTFFVLGLITLNSEGLRCCYSFYLGLAQALERIEARASGRVRG